MKVILPFLSLSIPDEGQKTDNTMAKRQTDNTMAKRTKTIYKALYRKLNIK
jgi:hypothetical protein